MTHYNTCLESGARLVPALASSFNINTVNQNKQFCIFPYLQFSMFVSSISIKSSRMYEFIETKTNLDTSENFNVLMPEISTVPSCLTSFQNWIQDTKKCDLKKSAFTEFYFSTFCRSFRLASEKWFGNRWLLFCTLHY